MSNTNHHSMIIKILNDQRNEVIADFRIFKQNPVNRKYMPHAAFDATRKEFRDQIAILDNCIRGLKLARKVTKETGVLHHYDAVQGVVYAPSNSIYVEV